ncbi:MAG: carboxynorspermidine decarboxylase [Lachnospira sp.]
MKFNDLKTPVYVIDEKRLKDNLRILQSVENRSGCHILLAQKAFSAFCEYPLIGQYISGTTASGLYEARLGVSRMGKENHVFAPAFKEEDMIELVKICDHVVFNSFSQLRKYRKLCLDAGVSIGIRINPEISTQGEHAIYDPCAPGSRLGITLNNFLQEMSNDELILSGIEGIHFHTLCEQNSDDLETTLGAVEERFGHILSSDSIKWVNFGGGHHITRKDYDIERLVRCINHIKDTYNVQVYLEPGEAVALNAGYLVTEVLDKVCNGFETLILDASAACHMPDVLEMPYTPPLMNAVKLSDCGIDIWGNKLAGEEPEAVEDDAFDNNSSELRSLCNRYPFRYRLSSYTCLAGDITGDYGFEREINTGDRLVFEDMAIYSMVKNNTFNGIPLPDIAVMDEQGECRVIKTFGYEDFESRLS